MPTKEDIYDDQISPLMEQIIAICGEHKIAHVCSFALLMDTDEDLCCTLCNVATDREPPGEFLRCVSILLRLESDEAIIP